MNLIRDPWLLVRTADGTTTLAAPWQITSLHDIDVAALSMMRPEFNGAAIQFLIGLLQTAVARQISPLDVVTIEDWFDLFEQPPEPEVLAAALEPFAPAFELLGDISRFLQDLELPTNTSKLLPIEQLLLESPGDNSIKLGKDLSIKVRMIES